MAEILDIDLYILERSSPKKASAEEDDLWAWDELEDEKAIQHKASEEEDGLRARYKYEDKKIVPHGTHKKLHQLFGQPNIRSILKRELTARKGSMIVSGMQLYAYTTFGALADHTFSLR